ncbi:arginase family protein [Fibrobacter sp.]|uniref:arginase family protein n=1 Tax=Fibrobacter sp. TaxID=35828 RepID=UPI0025CD1D97|nr:arginase family protein [Fibrobacter sp.]MDD7497814.1 arginase family protein [Fibrobacter sp.]MDY5724444.1 arginase family protein [Fibrobacter sp.]
MKSTRITIQDFTGVYAEQPFMQGLRKAASTDGEIRWFDCTRIDGTDCYCDDEAQAILRKQIEFSKTPALQQAQGPSSISTPGIHFFDNGNYHYMSKLWTDSIREPFDLVVFDHHPDMQPPRFEGILSCGGWIKEVLDNNKFMQNVTVIGVADHLVEEIREDLSQANAAEILDRVTFIRESELTAVTLEGRSPDRVHLTSHTTPAYISIDKDALSMQEAATNWDQGSLTFEQLAETLQALAQNRKILGIDICGERARDIGFEDTAAADALNNTLNEKLYNQLQSIHYII